MRNEKEHKHDKGEPEIACKLCGLLNQCEVKIQTMNLYYHNTLTAKVSSRHNYLIMNLCNFCLHFPWLNIYLFKIKN